MKYSEMIKFLKDNGLNSYQFVIAHEVTSQIDKEITIEEFEEICSELYEIYLDCIDEPDIYDLVNEELTNRNLKNCYM